jgi:hypothetical protein
MQVAVVKRIQKAAQRSIAVSRGHALRGPGVAIPVPGEGRHPLRTFLTSVWDRVAIDF